MGWGEGLEMLGLPNSTPELTLAPGPQSCILWGVELKQGGWCSLFSSTARIQGATLSESSRPSPHHPCPHSNPPPTSPPGPPEASLASCSRCQPHSWQQLEMSALLGPGGVLTAILTLPHWGNRDVVEREAGPLLHPEKFLTPPVLFFCFLCKTSH